jgi:1-deoxy-D-xylulose-5-phosphate synthase
MRKIEIGRAEVLREGPDVTLLGLGVCVGECLKAADILEEHGVAATVVDARFAKPLDQELIVRLAAGTGGIVTAEENVAAGGFGEAVLDLLSGHRLADRLLDSVTMPDAIVDHGPQATFRQIFELDGAGIARRTLAALERKTAGHGEAEAALTPA